MPRGGKRAGAGRKPGSANKRTREIADRAVAAGLTPLDYMLSVMRDSARNPADRLDAAHKAAPYVHPRLNSVEHKGSIDLKHGRHDLSDAELADIAAGRGEGTAEAETRPEQLN